MLFKAVFSLLIFTLEIYKVSADDARHMRLERLEQSLTKTRMELRTATSALTETQNELNDTRTELSTRINELEKAANIGKYNQEIM